MKSAWTTQALKNVCSIEKAKYSGSGLPYVGLEHIESNTGRYLGDRTPLAVKSSTFQFTPGHILFARLRPYLNKVFLPDFDGHCSSEIFPVQVGSSLDKKYLYYWLTWQPTVDHINKTSTGTRMPRANMSEVLEFDVPVPPLPEQERIVAILDRAFAGIDKAIANTEKNLASARELFESYLNSVFNQPDDRWTDKELDAFSKTVSTGPFGSVLHKSDYMSEGVPLVNPINIQGERIIPDAKKMISPKAAGRLRAYILNRGDIVIARRGEIGRCAVVTEEQDGWICGTGCFFIRPGAEVIPEFLAHLLRSAKYRERLERVATGATMPNLSNKALSTLHVSLPDVETQAAFVKDIAEFGAYCSNLQFTHEKQVTALAELKQSLLQKAFAGELTADAEREAIVRREGTYA